MPIAVVRRGAGELPFTVRLDDSNSMAGQRLSGVDAVDVEVQISYSGQPGRDNAQWLATRNNVVPSDDAALTMELQANEL
jgi:cytochrome c-type biogenesis protein CcmH